MFVKGVDNLLFETVISSYFCGFSEVIFLPPQVALYLSLRSLVSVGGGGGRDNSNQRKHHNKSLFSFFFQTVARAYGITFLYHISDQNPS